MTAQTTALDRIISPPYEYEHQQDGRHDSNAPQQNVLHGLTARTRLSRHEANLDFATKHSHCLTHLTMQKVPPP
jgi:hypothetical protein